MSKKNNGLIVANHPIGKPQGVKMTEDRANAPSMDDEPIIELNDLADDEPIIELTDVLEEVPVAAMAQPVADLAGETPDHEAFSLMTDDMMDDADSDHQDQDLVHSLGMEIEPLTDLPPVVEPAVQEQPAPVAPPVPTAALAPDPAQVDAAIERIIGPMVAERLDQILVDVIEKAVQREIERIKSLLLEQGP